MVRFLIAALLGMATTFGLFAFMAYLISGGPKNNAEGMATAPIEIVMQKPDSKTQTRQRTPPPPPPPPSQPPKMAPVEPDTADASADGLNISMPAIDMGNASVDIGSPGDMNRDGDATPIVRIEPRYPMQAARDGVEGWVKMSFTINETGGVEDVQVVDANPRRVFDKEATRALRKWKYRPKVVDGKAMKQTGMTVQLDFTLEK